MTDEQIIAHVKKLEGWPKYTEHKEDLGGPTKGGITLLTFRNWRKDHTLTKEDLKQLTEAEADAIYQFEFVQPFQLIKNSDLKLYLVDLGVLRGPRNAIRMLQDIVDTDADGWLGVETLKAMKPFEKHLLVMLIGGRFLHIAQRCRENKTQLKFKGGWRNRNASFLPKT